MTIKPRLGFDDSLDVFGIHGIAALAVSAVVAQCAPAQAESVVKLPAAVTDPAVKAKRAPAVLAGGCFWGLDGVFSNVPGVISVDSGYYGGIAATDNNETTDEERRSGGWGTVCSLSYDLGV